MLRDTPVLVLDEPTAGLDAGAARRVIDRCAVSGGPYDRHEHPRSEPASDADRILVVDGGRVTEAGALAQSTAQEGALECVRN